MIVGGEEGGRWLAGFQRQILWAPLLSLFVTQTLHPLTSSVRTEHLQVLRELIEANKIKPIIDRTYPLSEVPAAIRQLRNAHPRGKIVITA